MPASLMPLRRLPGGRRPLLLLLVMILSLSAYTHMWNPAGFPGLLTDEGVYVKRGVGILDGQILYGKHDHPFLGQVIIAGFMHVTGYPGLFEDPSADPQYLASFYAYPRAFMGLLAVIDTLLVYLIADRVFGRRVAAVSSVLFAVAPMSLMLRMVLLDSIMLPFVLASVLLALHSRGSGRRHALLLASGACMGLAIFVKVPAVAMVPPCVILAYWAYGRIRDVGLWLVPALAIPAAWPAYAVWAGQSDEWIRDVMRQAGRSNGGLPETIRRLFEFDPVLISLGMAGFALAVACLVLRPGRGRGEKAAGAGDLQDPPRRRGGRGLYGRIVRAGGGGGGTGYDAAELRRHGFLVAWFSSILLFFGAIGYVSLWHLGMLLPALCIAAAVLILRVGGRRVARSAGGRPQDRTALIAVVVIGLAGLSTTGVIVHLDTAMSEFDAVSFLLQDLDDPGATKVMHLTSWWVAEDVYGMQNATPYLRHDSQAGTGRVLLAISGERLDYFMQSGERCGDPATEADPNYCRVSHNVLDTYNGSTLIREFGRAGITDALPQLPYSIEKRLTNPWMVLERHPAR